MLILTEFEASWRTCGGTLGSWLETKKNDVCRSELPWYTGLLSHSLDIPGKPLAV